MTEKATGPAWLSFNDSALHKSGNRVRLGIIYAEDDRNKDGLCQAPDFAPQAPLPRLHRQMIS